MSDIERKRRWLFQGFAEDAPTCPAQLLLEIDEFKGTKRGQGFPVSSNR
jgi:hypothetical protein